MAPLTTNRPVEECAPAFQDKESNQMKVRKFPAYLTDAKVGLILTTRKKQRSRQGRASKKKKQASSIPSQLEEIQSYIVICYLDCWT